MKINRYNIKKYIIIGILAIIVIWWVTTRYLISDRAKIKKTIRKVRIALEDLDTNGVMKHISRDYHDKDGHTKREIFMVLFRYENIYRSIKVNIFSTDINIMQEGGDNIALVEIIATVNAIGKSERKIQLLDRSAEKYKFIFKFRKEGAKWKIFEFIDYQPLS